MEENVDRLIDAGKCPKPNLFVPLFEPTWDKVKIDDRPDIIASRRKNLVQPRCSLGLAWVRSVCVQQGSTLRLQLLCSSHARHRKQSSFWLLSSSIWIIHYFVLTRRQPVNRGPTSLSTMTWPLVVCHLWIWCNSVWNLPVADSDSYSSQPVSDAYRYVSYCCKHSLIRLGNTCPSISRAFTFPIAEIPYNRWQSIAIDFITGLPKSNGIDAIMTVTDRLTKMVHILPTTSNATASDIASLFFRQVVRFHGIPKDIVSDRDSNLYHISGKHCQNYLTLN